jgi:hypothetical protein
MKTKRINPPFSDEDYDSIQKLAKLKDRPMAYLVRQWALEGLERERALYRQTGHVKDAVKQTHKQHKVDIENMPLNP